MDIVVRASVIYVLLWLVTRGMGKRELTEFSPFELILLVILGDLIQQGVTQDDRSITGAAIAVATIGLWVIALSYLSFRSKRIGVLTAGLPIVIVRDGEPLVEYLRKERLRVEDVAEEARSQGIDDLARVRIGVLEADGSMSFVLDRGDEPPPLPQQQRRRTHPNLE